MGLFGSRRPHDSSTDSLVGRYLKKPESAIPVLQFDLAARYDIHCSETTHDRVYENVRILGIRTFDPISEFGGGSFGGYIEIETEDGVRIMIGRYQIRLICEPGKTPKFRVLSRRRPGPGVE
jgi:hypothetical protein